MIFEGKIEIDGREDWDRRQNLRKVYEGDVVWFPEYLTEEVPTYRERVEKKRDFDPRMKTMTLFMDKDVLVANKEENVPIVGGSNSLTAQLIRYGDGETPTLYPVFHLPDNFTGVVLFGRTPQSTSDLLLNFSHRRLHFTFDVILRTFRRDTENMFIPPRKDITVTAQPHMKDSLILRVNLLDAVSPMDLIAFLESNTTGTVTHGHCARVEFHRNLLKGDLTQVAAISSEKIQYAPISPHEGLHDI